MERQIVKPQDLDNMRGGDRIEFLSKPTCYAGAGKHIASKGPIFLN